MGSRDPLQGRLGLQGCGRDPAPPVSHTHVPPQLQLTLRFCFAATAKQVLLGYKKAAGSRAGRESARNPCQSSCRLSLAYVSGQTMLSAHGIAAQGTPQQRPKPQTRGHGAGSGSLRRAGPPRARRDRPTPGCAPWLGWHWPWGSSRCTPVLGRVGSCVPTSTVSPRGWHCTDAILPCLPSSDSLLILRQSGGKRAGTSVEVGLFSGKTKAAWPVPRPRGCSGLEELPEDRGPKFGAASV